MKTLQKISAVVIALVLLCSLAACATPVEGEKTITFTVVDADKQSTAFTITTEREYLADALVDEGILDAKAADGYYTTINGVTADYNKDQSWWCVTQDGVMTNYGLNDLVIEDGDSFEATYTIG